MSSLHVTWVDVAIVAVLAVSTLSALLRGFVRETLSLFAWAAAAFAAIYFGHYAVALLAPHVSPMIAELGGRAAMFLLVLIPLSLIAYRISERVRGSPVGTLDRSLGGAFGMLRGLAVVAVGYLLLSAVVPAKAQPNSIREARLLPLMQVSAETLRSLIPANAENYLQKHTGPVANSALRVGASVKSGKGSGIAKDRALDTLIGATVAGGSGKKP
jgi:membrane protein required for colicin V production